MMRALEQDLPRWDGRSPALKAKHESLEEKNKRLSHEKASLLMQVGRLQLSLDQQKKLTEDARREASKLAAIINAEPQRPLIGAILPNARTIIREVAVKHGITPGEILSPRKSHPLIAARDEAIMRVYEERPDYSLPQIGRIFRRDHTTILHAIRKMQDKQEGEAA